MGQGRPSSYDPRALPPPETLARTCRGLATRDAILSEDWEARTYSFDAAWAHSERVASTRNAEGDERFVVFCPEHAFVRAFWRECVARDPAQVYEGRPVASAPLGRASGPAPGAILRIARGTGSAPRAGMSGLIASLRAPVDEPVADVSRSVSVSGTVIEGRPRGGDAHDAA